MQENLFAELQSRPHNFSLTGRFYNDPDAYQLDLEQIWYKSWIFAGHVQELSEVGDFMTFPLGEHNIVIINRGDQLAAFYNRCPYSGNQLCQGEYGNQRQLGIADASKQYHLDGTPLNKADKALEHIALNSIESFIYITLATKPDDFAQFQAMAGPYIAPHNLQNAKVACQSDVIEAGNWKLVFENNRECYHCLSNHPELIITFPEDPSLTGVNPNGQRPPVVLEHWERCEAVGMPSEFYLSEKGDYRVVRLPLLKNATSFTLNGDAAVNKPLCDPRLGNPGSMLKFHFPNTWNHMLGDHVLSFRLLPLSPQRTLVTTKWLVHKDAEEGVDYQLSTLREVWQATNAQDQHLVEENQRGINSPLYQPGPYSQDYEIGVMQFINWYTDTLKRRLNEAIT